MAKTSTTKKMKADESGTGAEPRYPYVVVPKSLRRFLELIPQKPKPPKITNSTLKTWGFRSGNDNSILRVLKSIELLAPTGEPTQSYADYMKPGTGSAVLGRQLKQHYEELFQNVANPEKAANDELRSFFNINSGGSERTIQLQIDTFKALAAYATFGGKDPLGQEQEGEQAQNGSMGQGGSPVIRIDLHIHLPENKTKSDYDAIIESIANHLYKHQK